MKDTICHKPTSVFETHPNPSIFLEAYQLIAKTYGEEKAQRSGVPLMNHIDEGLSILMALPYVDSRSEDVLAAYCLHPIVQNGMDVVIPESLHRAKFIAELYSLYANKTLCDKDFSTISDISKKLAYLPKMPKQIAYLLLADKVQNFKDFNLYHKGVHPRSAELQQYFTTWIAYLRRIIRDYD